ncbi:MAG: HD-GYP domain-containing protein [Clostridia bacterium]|nr:MAG: HD-GYP domain-containing protein [Clostridia bacterium]
MPSIEQIRSINPLDITGHTRFSLPVLTACVAAVTLVVWFTTNTTQQIMFILFGAPVIYAGLAFNLRAGAGIAAYAAATVTTARWPVLVQNWQLAQWEKLFFEGFFVPFFYLAFCLFIAWIMLRERQLSRECRDQAGKLATANQRNLELFVSILKAMMAAVEAKDTYTRGHSERVTGYALAIGRELGLGETEIRSLFCAAILHDIGKIGVPGELLRKPGPLDPQEYEIVKSHPALGASMLEGIEFLRDLLPVIAHHHEWYNGKGYPDGLAGKDIPLGARIIAVADAYDAMISERPYRCVRSPAQAKDELNRCRGTQFDPELVDAFLRVLEREGDTPKLLAGAPADLYGIFLSVAQETGGHGRVA